MAITLSAINSSTTNLVAGNGYAFSGNAEGVSTMTSIAVHLYSDQAGTLYTEFSHDGSLWTSSTAHAYSAGTLLNVSQAVQDVYFRVTVAGDAVATTVFSLNTRLLSNARPEETLDSATDSVTAQQGGAPWSVTIPALSAGTDSIEARLYDSAGNGILSTLNAAHVLESNSGLLLADTNALVARTPVLGQAAMAASVPVVIASDQPDLGVTEARWNAWTQASVTTAVTVNAAASSLGRVHIYNSSGATAYVSFFDLASGSVVLGTTAPVIVLPVPNSTSLVFDARVVFATEIAIASVTAHGGNTASAAGVDVCVTYQ